MFFLLRCLFWLGLVFSHIAEQQGFDPAALLDGRAAVAARIAKESAGSIQKESAAGLGALPLEAASRQCRAEPEKCLALVARAARLAPQGANPNPTASRDTLGPGDRAPAWRLRPGVAADAGRHE
ncbi:hypothetical protein [uncultured Rhodoblastus sp.]|uniref:hypothetical protein n=1 Tax=uncultured Rhodoblastus sp. TaxID=543037 RepID=UPI0025E36465|nr:hypothetical protein [uncultured Rhodoblastus sp.]